MTTDNLPHGVEYGQDVFLATKDLGGGVHLRKLLLVDSTGSPTGVVGKISIDQTTPGSTNAVVPGGTGYTVSVTDTRPNDTTAYAANDVASNGALVFAGVGAPGGNIMITGVNLEVDLAAIPSGMTSFDLHLYGVTPPSASADNAAWDLPSGDRASYLGKISLGAPADLGSTLYVEQSGINKQVKLAGANLYAYLVTVGAYTPTALSTRVITLHAVGL